jgi:hypothetical protein
MQGIDYAFAPHPAPAVIAGHGYKFACRYMSPIAVNDSNGKNLLAAELAALRGAGLDVVVVEESTAGRMRSGHAAGVADAQHAQAVTAALGMHDVPVYFACDFDATPADQVAINAYLDGAASVIGRARTGIYGGFWAVSRALDAGAAAWAWQTSAWSGGQWDPRAHIRQQGTVTIGGADCDIDEAMTADFGQWPRPAAPAPQPAAPQYPVPSVVSVTPRPSLAVSWPEGSPQSPHWRVQVMADDNGRPGAVIDGGSVVVTDPRAVIPVPAPGRYWVKVQAAGDSPFTAPKAVTA